MSVNFQRVEKSFSSKIELAKRYYGLIFLLNGINITDRELDLVSFSAINGTISTPPVREEFMKVYDISKAHVYNLTAKLQKMSILIKDKDNKIRINNSIYPDFSNKELVMVIKLIENAN